MVWVYRRGAARGNCWVTWTGADVVREAGKTIYICARGATDPPLPPHPPHTYQTTPHMRDWYQQQRSPTAVPAAQPPPTRCAKRRRPTPPLPSDPAHTLRALSPPPPAVDNGAGGVGTRRSHPPPATAHSRTPPPSPPSSYSSEGARYSRRAARPVERSRTSARGRSPMQRSATRQALAPRERHRRGCVSAAMAEDKREARGEAGALGGGGVLAPRRTLRKRGRGGWAATTPPRLAPRPSATRLAKRAGNPRPSAGYGTHRTAVR